MKGINMITRIRYTKDQNNNLVTRTPLLLAGELVNITLSPEHLSYVITNANDGRVVATDTAKSMQMLKINVKKQLRSRGAVFNDEVRTR
jgi:ABC-type oligopeptide transport system substrate-binding subunit